MTLREIREDRKPRYKKFIILFWVMWALGLIAMAAYFILTSGSDDLPSTEEMQNPKNNLATEVIAVDGSLLGRYYVENRVKVPYREINKNLIHALISTEDERFYNHAGVDLEALGRVVKGLALGTTSKGGGSTISQQLAKLLYTDQVASSLVERAQQKPKEWITAVQLERQYTKEEIIEMYLNKFDFLYNAHGIKSASETYFGIPQDSLNIPQAAVLVGMLKNPSLYNPKRFPERAKVRKEVVMKQMVKAGHITEEEYYKLIEDDIELSFSRKTHSEGIAPYFREELRKEVKKILKELSIDGKEYNVHTDGLRIYTTIDPKMQQHAEDAMWKQMAKQQKTFFKHWEDKDPWTYGDLTKSQKEMRQNAFKRIVRESDRFSAHQEEYLAEILSVILQSYDLDIRLYDIDRMLKAEEDSGYLSKLVSKNLLSKEKSSKYRKLMRSAEWKRLKNQWSSLEAAVEKDFNTKTKMKVFAYTPERQKDTIMTPYDSLRYLRMHLQTGSLVLDPKTGAIKAWVGGINHKYFKFDHVNPSVERQVGSTFKPFVYATAVEDVGISPCYKVVDMPYTIHDGEGCFEVARDWTPKNASGEYTGEELNLFQALKQSKNSISAFLMKQIGCHEPVRNLARNMGIDVDKENVYGEPRVPKQPSICLGAVDLSVYEMTGAYGTFANNGSYNKPYFIDRIEDRTGTVIYKSKKGGERVLPAASNHVMVTMMKKVAEGVQGQVKSEVAGKTGTTNQHADGWFMGFTPNLVIGTWVGGDDRWIRFRSLALGQGGRMARPFFVDFLKRVEADTSINLDVNERFKIPQGDLGIKVDCDGIPMIDLDRDFSNPDNEFGDSEDIENPITPPFGGGGLDEEDEEAEEF